jgi:HSP20 family protein
MPVRLLAAQKEDKTMSEVYFGRSDLFGVFDRLQRQFSSLLGDFPTGIRAGQLGAFPSVNIGTTDDTIEIIAFAPDIHPAELEVSINGGLLPSAANTKRAPAPRDELRT